MMLVPWAIAITMVLASACARPVPKGDFATCRGFLETAEVAQVTGLGSLKAVLRPGGHCEIYFSSPDGLPSIYINIRRFDSIRAARSEFDIIRDGLRLQVRERLRQGLLGADSYGAEAYQNTDSFMGFRERTYLVVIYTSRDIWQPPATLGQLKQLAELVRGRLP